MEDRFHFIMRHEGRLARLGRREITYKRADGTLIFSVRQQFSFRDAELGEMVVFAFARKEVQIEQSKRLAGFGVAYRVKLEVADPFVGRFYALKF